MASISVIVPVYKVEAFLSRCVDSILAQSYRDFELILVDDGSPDNCGAICDAYARRDSRIHVIHQENGGLSAARNAGIDWVMKNSESQWLAFVDSDDWVHADYLRLLYEAVTAAGCRISACDFFRTSGDGFPEEEEKKPQAYSADDYYCGDVHKGGATAVAWNKLYDRALFTALRYPVGLLNEDEFTTYLAVYEAGSVAVVEKRLYAYYQNPNGIMLSKWNPRRLHILQAFEEQIEYARKKDNRRLLRKAAKAYVLSIHEQLQKAERGYHKELRAKLRRGLKLGRDCGAFPCNWENLWAYEEAYPVKPAWWLLFKTNAVLHNRKRKDAEK